MFSVADLLPYVAGLNVTVTLQVAAAARVFPLQVSAVIASSVLCVVPPYASAVVMAVLVTPPVFVTVNVCVGAGVEPTRTGVGKVYEVGAIVREAGASPVPVSDAAAVPPGEAVAVSDADFDPAVADVRTTESVSNT